MYHKSQLSFLTHRCISTSNVSNNSRSNFSSYQNSRRFIQLIQQKLIGTTFKRITQYIILLFIGFAVVTFGLYFTSIQSSTVVLPSVILNSICVKKSIQGIHCKIEQEKVLHLYNSLVLQVQDKYIKNQCHNSDIEPTVDAQTVFEFISMYEHLLSREVEELVVLLEIIAKTYSDSPIGFDTKFNVNVLPNLPILCAIKNIFVNIFSLVFWIGIVALNIGNFYFGICFFLLKSEKHKQEVNRLIEIIINSLKQEAQCQHTLGYLPIIHIRDQLIPSNERLTKSKIWAEVEQCLELDSRVKSEIREIEGEDFKVWRWIKPVSPACSLNTEEKVWQVEALKTKETINSPLQSSTSCLKICFELGLDSMIKIDYKTFIKNAILEKCEDVEFVHIFVDCYSQERSIFFKCTSPSEAEKAYKQFYGIRYHGQLITVILLCLECYHQKFPDAVCLTKPLKPPNFEKYLS